MLDAAKREGKLFLYTSLSLSELVPVTQAFENGQTVFRDIDRIPARPEVGFINPAIDKAKLKLFPASPSLADRVDTLSAEFRDLFVR